MTTSERILLISSTIQYDEEFAKKCLLLIYARQLEDEQDGEETRYDNCVGFNRGDAPVLTVYAKGVLKELELSPGYMRDMQERMVKYSSQLETILPHDEFE